MYKFDAGLVNENPKGLCVAAAIQNNKSEREGGGGGGTCVTYWEMEGRVSQEYTVENRESNDL